MTWTVDATSGIAFPANATEWASFISTKGLKVNGSTAMSNPNMLHLLQEASGNLADSIGSFTLTPTTISYQQAMTGSTRKGVGITADSTSRVLTSSASLPDFSVNSQANSFAFFFPAYLTEAPSANRDICESAGVTLRARITSTPRLALVSGANSVTGTKDPVNGTFLAWGGALPVLIVLNRTLGTLKIYTSQEKLTCTIGTMASKTHAIGGTSSGNVADAQVVGYHAAWIGAPAEFTDETAYALLTTMGYSVAWSVADLSAAGSATATFQTGTALSAAGDSSATFVESIALTASGASTATFQAGTALSAAGSATATFQAGTALSAAGSATATFQTGTALNATGSATAAFQVGTALNATGSATAAFQAGTALNAAGDSSADFTGEGDTATGSAFTAAGDSTAMFAGAGGVTVQGRGKGGGYSTPTSTAAEWVLWDDLPARIKPSTPLIPSRVVRASLAIAASAAVAFGGAATATARTDSAGNSAATFGGNAIISARTDSAGNSAATFGGSRMLDDAYVERQAAAAVLVEQRAQQKQRDDAQRMSQLRLDADNDLRVRYDAVKLVLCSSSRFDVIVAHGSSFVVMNEARTRVLGGPYKTKAEAEARLRQIDYFKAHPHKDAAPDAALQTARRALMLRAAGLGNRRTRMPRQLWPKLIELEYGKAMIAQLERARPALAPLLNEIPGMVERARAERGDAINFDAGEPARVRELIDKARAALEQQTRPSEIESIARLFGERTQTYQRVQLGRQVRAALGADVFASDHRIATLVDHFVHENAVLIKSVPGNVIDQIEKLTTQAFTNARPVGTSVRAGVYTGEVAPATLTEDLAARFGIGERHARLIARDQIGKLYGQTNAYRQQDLGITSFVWETAGDERVRPEHEDLNGQEFDYSDPPSEGLPGEPICCRCGARPVFSNILDAGDAATSDDDE